MRGPIAEESLEDFFDIRRLWWGRKVVALKVRGTAMADEGLRDGDHLIVEPRDTANDGQTVVAEVEGQLTVKRVFREADGRLRLMPANPEMLPLTVAATRVRVVGILVGVFRRQGFPATRRNAPPPPPRAAGDERTLDLTLRVIDQSVEQAETSSARRSGIARARLEAEQGLANLSDCYVDRGAEVACSAERGGALVRRDAGRRERARTSRTSATAKPLRSLRAVRRPRRGNAPLWPSSSRGRLAGRRDRDPLLPSTPSAFTRLVRGMTGRALIAAYSLMKCSLSVGAPLDRVGRRTVLLAPRASAGLSRSPARGRSECCSTPGSCGAARTTSPWRRPHRRRTSKGDRSGMA